MNYLTLSAVTDGLRFLHQGNPGFRIRDYNALLSRAIRKLAIILSYLVKCL